MGSWITLTNRHSPFGHSDQFSTPRSVSEPGQRTWTHRASGAGKANETCDTTLIKAYPCCSRKGAQHWTMPNSAPDISQRDMNSEEQHRRHHQLQRTCHSGRPTQNRRTGITPRQEQTEASKCEADLNARLNADALLVKTGFQTWQTNTCCGWCWKKRSQMADQFCTLPSPSHQKSTSEGSCNSVALRNWSFITIRWWVGSRSTSPRKNNPNFDRRFPSLFTQHTTH